MDGILLINKPKDMTSHDVVNIVRKVYQTKKVGHTGTLDPDATGLLVLGINNGTKIMQYLNSDEKTYQATICIGIATDTLDKTGEIIDQKPVQPIADIDTIITSFQGEYIQIPPMYSAIKYQGKKLYEYARKGIVIEDRPHRRVDIFDIHRTSDVVYSNNCAYVDYIVHGSKGLYVRTLSHDIGQKCGYPAHNYDLHRIQAGSFNVRDSYTIEQIKQSESRLISLSDALEFMNTKVLHDGILNHVKHGMAISLTEFDEAVLTKIVDENHQLVAIYDKHPTEHKMKAQNIFYKD